MKKKPVTRQEKIFLAVSVAVSALLMVSAYLFTAPLIPMQVVGSASSTVTLLDAARVDLNTAGLDALCTLPGIGEKKAQAIIDDRQANGLYQKLEDVARVSGITQNTIAQWADLAYVS